MKITKLVNNWLLIAIIINEFKQLTKLVEVFDFMFLDRGSTPLSSTKNMVKKSSYLTAFLNSKIFLINLI